MFNALVPIVALAIPIVAIIGGITAGIVRTLGQQKIAELAMRERIAALEKGLDLARLPALPTVGDPGEASFHAVTPRERALRTSQGLRIGGLVTVAGGTGLAVLLVAIPESRETLIWLIGLIPVLVGLALLAAGQMVRREAPPAAPPERAAV
jgi:hypothetical protein